MSDLISAQKAVFAGLDADLPPLKLPEGERLTATAPEGDVEGIVYRADYADTDVHRLWEPPTVWEFTPLIGDTGAGGMHAALAAFGKWFDGQDHPATDTAIRVLWPSRDVPMAPAMMEHGFVPMTTLAIRTSRPGPAATTAGVHVRRATLDDVDTVVAVQAEELKYSAPLTAAKPPANVVALMRHALRATLFAGRVLIAEVDGAAVGAVDAGIVTVGAGTSIDGKLPEGLWGYIGTMSVVPDWRGRGVGRALVDQAHRLVFANERVQGAFLFYEQANPLSSVFWPRRGYRPLWTKWTCRPASRFRG